MLLKQEVRQWAQDKGLLTDVTPERIEEQSLKVLEEIGETAGALLKGNREELIDGIGDIAVTIIILAAMKGTYIKAVETSKADQHLLLNVTELIIFYTQDSDPYYLDASYNQLTKFAESQGLDLEDCLQSAYDVISKRTGKMINGTFIKD
jgi:phosphoribosyl-ATP pyrophosphohydrolase